MFDRYVKSLFLGFSCCFMVAVCQADQGVALQIRSSIGSRHLTCHECQTGKYGLTLKRCPATVTRPLPSFHSIRVHSHDTISCRPARTAQTCQHNPSRNWCTKKNSSASSCLHPAFLTASPDYVSEANLAGEWELRFYPDGPWEDMRTLLAACKQTALADDSMFFLALRELYENSHRPSFSMGSIISFLVPVSHPCIHLKLQPDRLGIPKDTRFPPAVWQLKRRPFSSLYIELEMAFLPENPQFMLVFEAPVLPGDHFSESVRVQEGTVSLATAPFLPWQKSKIGRFTLTPKTLQTIIDPLLL